MNKTEYMDSLKSNLKRLSQEDLNKALEYFEEYFADAGEQNEQKAMEDLGSPLSAAEQIIMNMAIANTNEPVKDMKKGLNAVWIGILATAPIALPLALVAVMMILVVFLLFLCGYLAGVTLLLTFPMSIVAAFTQITTGIPYFITCLGIGLVSLGLGLLILKGMTAVSKRFLSWCIRLFGGIAAKTKKKAGSNQ